MENRASQKLYTNPTVLTFALMLQSSVCLVPSVVVSYVCNVMYVAKRCILQQKLLLIAYRKSYDTIEEFNVDSKAEYSTLSSTRRAEKKLKQTSPVPL